MFLCLCLCWVTKCHFFLLLTPSPLVFIVLVCAGEMWDPKDLCKTCGGKKVMHDRKILEVRDFGLWLCFSACACVCVAGTATSVRSLVLLTAVFGWLCVHFDCVRARVALGPH